MVSTLEICECDPAKPPAQRWKAEFCFYERGKNTEGVEQLFEVHMFQLQVMRKVKVVVPLCIFSVSRKSIFGNDRGSQFPDDEYLLTHHT